MKYVDMHCDTVTQCLDGGYSLEDCGLQINLAKLNNNGCAAQCFAIFTQGDGAAMRFYRYLDFYNSCGIKKILNFTDLESCLNGVETGGILTVENLGFIGKDLSRLYALSKSGVKMVSPVWNFENDLAYPNLLFRGGMPAFSERERRGLKPLGKEAVEILDGLKIIVDISHLSDGGAEDILRSRKIPIVASHSNAAAVCGVSRNLTDGLIKKIAACGGVIGINFCKDFLGAGDTFDLVLKHIRHIINTGGEEVIALGSDFDGIPAPPGLEDCSKMPKLLDFLSLHGVKGGTLEKLCFKNFARVFKEVCG